MVPNDATATAATWHPNPRSADPSEANIQQSYGRSVDSLQPTWETFAPLIPAERYLIGFSFYEEFDRNRWDDISEPFEDSRAVAYADWQPAGATKAGVFSYAIDRDGAPFLDDAITATDYPWTRRLGERLRSREG